MCRWKRDGSKNKQVQEVGGERELETPRRGALPRSHPLKFRGETSASGVNFPGVASKLVPSLSEVLFFDMFRIVVQNSRSTSQSFSAAGFLFVCFFMPLALLQAFRCEPRVQTASASPIGKHLLGRCSSTEGNKPQPVGSLKAGLRAPLLYFFPLLLLSLRLFAGKKQQLEVVPDSEWKQKTLQRHKPGTFDSVRPLGLMADTCDELRRQVPFICGRRGGKSAANYKPS